MSTLFADTYKRWCDYGFDPAWAVSEQMWDVIDNELMGLMLSSASKKPIKTLEFGSGLSTVMFSLNDRFCDHTALEFDSGWADRYHSLLQDVPGIEFQDIETLDSREAIPDKHIVLVDGLVNGRDRLVNYTCKSIRSGGLIIVDDVNRDEDYAVFQSILRNFGGGKTCIHKSTFGRKFATIRVSY